MIVFRAFTEGLNRFSSFHLITMNDNQALRAAEYYHLVTARAKDDLVLAEFEAEQEDWLASGADPETKPTPPILVTYS